MIVDIRYFGCGPEQIQGVRLVSVYPHNEYGYNEYTDEATIEVHAELVLHYKAPGFGQQNIKLSDIHSFTISED